MLGVFGLRPALVFVLRNVGHFGSSGAASHPQKVVHHRTRQRPAGSLPEMAFLRHGLMESFSERAI